MGAKPQFEEVEQLLASTESEIQSLETKIKNLRVDREAFLITLNRLRSKAPAQHPELPAMQPTDERPSWGLITNAVVDVVAASSVAVSPSEVTDSLLKRGIRPNGDAKNFPVTVAKTLKRLVGKQLVEFKNGRSVTYSLLRTKRSTETNKDQTLALHINGEKK
jgi:hypothetical protein